MKIIFMIRHAQPDFPGGIPICMGQRYDYPLSPLGKRQAQEIGAGFPSLPVERILTSPLKRCTETALPLGERFSLTPVEDKRLSELRGGVWDGMTLEAMHREYPDYFQEGAPKTPPEGETDSEGLERILEALHEFSAAVEQYGIIVTHSGIGRLLVSTLLKKSAPRRLCMEYASITPILIHERELSFGALPMNTKELNLYLKEQHLC